MNFNHRKQYAEVNIRLGNRLAQLHKRSTVIFSFGT
jgi:hypothetical protein